MKQKMTFNPTFKQTFQLNLKMQKSLDFLKLSENDIHAMVRSLLQTNPFIEINEKKEDSFYYLENIAQKHTLKEELYFQLTMLKQEYDYDIISYLIESLDNKGFLNLSKEQYMYDLNINNDIFDKHLNILQSLEPIGVGAFDCFDSICLQLKHKGLNTSYKIMKESKDLILSKNYTAISKKYHITKYQVNQIYEDIRLCEPFPCEQYNNENDSIIIPDIEIIIENNDIIIQPYNDFSFYINEDLYELVKDNHQMKDYFRDAHFFLDNLTKRNHTILMVANTLVNIQRSHFLYNDELVSCTLDEVAYQCHYHVSTISRTINSKYYMFHNEIYPLKNLLVSKSASGDSSDAIKKAMKDLIDNEDKKNQLSDQEIVEALKDIDLYCSRRVINKYRKKMGIPASPQRKIK